MAYGTFLNYSLWQIQKEKVVYDLPKTFKLFFKEQANLVILWPSLRQLQINNLTTSKLVTVNLYGWLVNN